MCFCWIYIHKLLEVKQENTNKRKLEEGGRQIYSFPHNTYKYIVHKIQKDKYKTRQRAVRNQKTPN